MKLRWLSVFLIVLGISARSLGGEGGAVRATVMSKTNPAAMMQSPQDERFIAKVKERFLSGSESIEEHRGDFEIAENETLAGDLLVAFGDLTVSGKVEGTVVVIEGDIFLSSSAVVSGDAVSVNGGVKWERGSRVDGEMVEAVMRHEKSAPPKIMQERKIQAGSRHGYREWRGTWQKSRYNRTWPRRYEHHDAFLIHYNRVQGLFLGANLPPRFTAGGNLVNFDLFGFLGYGFAGKAWRYQLNGEVSFLDNVWLRVGGSLYDLTDTEDTWRIPRDENALAASMIKEDFYDYFRRFGAGVYIAQNITSHLELRAGYYKERYESLQKNTNWSLFGGDKHFRSNPAIDAGKSVAYKASLTLDTRDRMDAPGRGWYIQAHAIWSRPEYGSAFDFDRYLFDIRRYIPIGAHENLNLRMLAGSARGDLPRQHLFFLGGISSLRAHDFKELEGDRMLLANIEYALGPNNQKLHDNWLLGDLNLIFFVDTGLAWFSDDVQGADEGFGKLTWERLETDYGIGFASDDGRVRLNIARSAVSGRNDLVFSFRLNRPF